jgi:cytochrome b6-f complex iron-sulfur subunit
MNRKEFIKNCSFACLGVTVFSSLIQSCASSNYFAQYNTLSNIVTIKKAEFIKIEKEKISERKYILHKSEKYNFPICIYKINDITYSALLMECTHNGCELLPQGGYLVCPCHGSEFTNTGIVQNPPAEANLKSFKITTDDENIYLQI